MSQKEKIIMRYLGGLRGAGNLTWGDEAGARADYDFEGFQTGPGQVMCSGEIRLAPDVLRSVFGRRDVQLVTDDGRRLSLRFSERQLAAASDSAHVDVAGDLPPASEWRH
ncbi:hypothetical protein [Shumkonia mesophila]|uniref:hypothetical protein n=1 Tax=Shumkonia mesophila TaxID=2838854 RepID=UPI002934F496|nr:hypothetical protein [Shumkonia mesophila]